MEAQSRSRIATEAGTAVHRQSEGMLRACERQERQAALSAGTRREQAHHHFALPTSLQTWEDTIFKSEATCFELICYRSPRR